MVAVQCVWSFPVVVHVWCAVRGELVGRRAAEVLCCRTWLLCLVSLPACQAGVHNKPKGLAAFLAREVSGASTAGPLSDDPTYFSPPRPSGKQALAVVCRTQCMNALQYLTAHARWPPTSGSRGGMRLLRASCCGNCCECMCGLTDTRSRMGLKDAREWREVWAQYTCSVSFPPCSFCKGAAAHCLRVASQLHSSMVWACGMRRLCRSCAAWVARIVMQFVRRLLAVLVFRAWSSHQQQRWT